MSDGHKIETIDTFSVQNRIERADKINHIDANLEIYSDREGYMFHVTARTSQVRKSIIVGRFPDGMKPNLKELGLC